MESPGRLISVPVKLGASFERGQAARLFDVVQFGYDVSADAQRFLMVLNAEDNPRRAPLTVVTNWETTLKK